MAKVLILGGQGRIGRAVAADIAVHTPAQITITGRQIRGGVPEPYSVLALDLADSDRVQAVIRDLGRDRTAPDGETNDGETNNVVVHCAGPFHHRDTQVLEACIAAGVNYVDVSDHPSYTRKALELQAAAQAAGITAVINTGIFPGISNSMVRQAVECLDQPESIHLSYVVGGSGGAGLTVMRTTFLGLQRPFQAWLNGQWQTVQPYSQREAIAFPPPYGRTGVYWFDMPETFTLPMTFPVASVVTKFGTVPDFYNYLTWTVARGWHPWLLRQPAVIEFLSRVSYAMTQVSDRLSGIGVAIRAEVTGQRQGQPTRAIATLVHPNTAIAAGYGTGSVVELLRSGQVQKPGVWVVEAAVPTDLFLQTMQARQLVVDLQTEPASCDAAT
jgi:saccharopine dehydrogenase-like NADP-dependent oxidoreductase